MKIIQSLGKINNKDIFISISIFFYSAVSLSVFMLLNIMDFLVSNITYSMFFIYYFWIFFDFSEAESNINKYLFQGGIHEKI